jgi:hypothetical protein
MKKSTLFIALAVGTTTAFAQDLTSKKGEPYLPEANDWAISFDATSFLNYAGNLFSGATSSNAAPTANWTNPNYMSITGKMFKDATTAYRATVRLNFQTNSRTGQIPDASSTAVLAFPTAPPMKSDVAHMSQHNVAIGLGMEKRRGKTRLQGFYGADAFIWTGSMTAKYNYGNTLTATGTPTIGVSPGTTTDFGSNAVLTAIGKASNVTGITDSYGNAARITTANIGTTFGIGVRAFIGAEYFIFPKIAIGAEYGWGFGFQTTGSSKYTIESMNPAPAGVGTQTITVKSQNAVGVDTDINGGGSGTGSGSIKLTLHF